MIITNSASLQGFYFFMASKSCATTEFKFTESDLAASLILRLFLKCYPKVIRRQDETSAAVVGRLGLSLSFTWRSMQFVYKLLQ